MSGNLTPTQIPNLSPPFSPDNSLLEVPPSIVGLRPGVTLLEFLEKELSVQRLNIIHEHLWIAGRVGNVRPLHHQKVMQRDIIITERADLHLVWHESRIYLKPLPKFLLNHLSFKEKICSPELHKNACGLLLSYTNLICHDSDLQIAKDLKLLPSSVEWEQWSTFAAEVCSKVAPQQANERYIYGELRLSRLNLVYRFLLWEYRGFHYGYTRYATFFERNFGWLVLVFAYVSVVLSALQVGIGTKQGGENARFQRVSYEFSVFFLVAVVVVVFMILSIFLGMFVNNLVATLVHTKRREDVERNWGIWYR